MVVLCTTAALADPVEVTPHKGQVWYKNNTNLDWTPIDQNESVPIFLYSAPYHFFFPYYFSLTSGEDLYFQPFYTYTGRFFFQFQFPGDIQYDLIDFSGYFILANGDDPTDPNWDFVNVKDYCITFDSVRNQGGNSATNMVTYYYNYSFRLDDSIDYNTYDTIAIYYPLSRNRIEANTSLLLYYWSLTNVTYDLTGDAYQDAVRHQLTELAVAIQEQGDAIQQEIHDGIQDILDSNDELIDKVQQLRTFLQTYFDNKTNYEDSETQSRANRGQAEASSTFDNTNFLTGFTSVLNAISSTSSSFSFYFPSSGTVPILDTVLWERQVIPFKTWIDNLPLAVLASARFVFWFACIASIFWHFKNLLDMLGGNDK